ncbi:unnamed protein product [Effrenium voratum]|nr:unnamed protein product [Effrenium voratum]
MRLCHLLICVTLGSAAKWHQAKPGEASFSANLSHHEVNGTALDVRPAPIGEHKANSTLLNTSLQESVKLALKQPSYFLGLCKALCACIAALVGVGCFVACAPILLSIIKRNRAS